MPLIDYTIKDNYINIEGTNEAGDVFISALCLPWINGVHAGISFAVSYHYEDIKAQLWKGEQVFIRAYSMGGAFALELTRRLIKDGYFVKCVTRGAYPVHLIPRKLGPSMFCREYGNDIVTKLFPWFRIPRGAVRHEGPRRCWWKFSLSDHVRY